MSFGLFLCYIYQFLIVLDQDFSIDLGQTGKLYLQHILRSTIYVTHQSE